MKYLENDVMWYKSTYIVRRLYNYQSLYSLYTYVGANQKRESLHAVRLMYVQENPITGNKSRHLRVQEDVVGCVVLKSVM